MNTITTIIFDLHEVLLAKRYWAMFQVAARLALSTKLGLISLHPKNLLLFINLYLTTRVPEHWIERFIKQNPQAASYREQLINVFNVQNPVKETCSIAQRLKQQGLILYMFSNIGQHTLTLLKPLHPEIFCLFDDIICTSNHDQWLQKPHIQAFKKLRARIDRHPQECLFIDNNWHNITVAKKCGFDIIHYKNSKLLQTVLKKRKILS